MTNMFHGTISFHQSLEGWKIPLEDSLKNVEGMFTITAAYCQPPLMKDFKFTNASLKSAVILFSSGQHVLMKALYGPISDWDVSDVTDMGQLFQYKESFNEDLSRWDVSNVTNMSDMFYAASSFNQPLNSWKTSKVNNMSCMFCDAFEFNQPIDGLDVSSVVSMSVLHVQRSLQV
jgi:surface protein